MIKSTELIQAGGKLLLFQIQKLKVLLGTNVDAEFEVDTENYVHMLTTYHLNTGKMKTYG